MSGWIGIGEDWYYFDPTAFAGLDGEAYADNGIRFYFNNGRVTEGTWVRNSEGRRCRPRIAKIKASARRAEGNGCFCPADLVRCFGKESENVIFDKRYCSGL